MKIIIPSSDNHYSPFGESSFPFSAVVISASENRYSYFRESLFPIQGIDSLPPTLHPLTTFPSPMANPLSVPASNPPIR